MNSEDSSIKKVDPVDRLDIGGESPQKSKFLRVFGRIASGSKGNTENSKTLRQRVYNFISAIILVISFIAIPLLWREISELESRTSITQGKLQAITNSFIAETDFASTKLKDRRIKAESKLKDRRIKAELIFNNALEEFQSATDEVNKEFQSATDEAQSSLKSAMEKVQEKLESLEDESGIRKPKR